MSQPPEGPGLGGLPRYPGSEGQPTNPYAAGDPYGYYPPQPPPQSHRTNGLAVAGFIVSIVGVSVVGIVLSIIGLRQIKQRGDRGRGFAIAGLVLSGCWAALLGVGLLMGFGGGVEAETGDETAVASLRVGQCYDGDPTKRFALLKVVDCAATHDGEAYAKVPVDLTKVAGEKEDLAASVGCATDFEPFIGIPYDDSKLEVVFLVLEDRQDPAGNVLCMVTGPAGERLTGTLRGSRR